jgi:RNA polymerase sigma factor (sigma-70 family)
VSRHREAALCRAADPWSGRDLTSQQITFCRAMTAGIVRVAGEAGLRVAAARDVAQTVWLKFFARFLPRAADAFGERERGWLFDVARHEIANVYRARRRRRTQSLGAKEAALMDSHERVATRRASDDVHSALFRRWLEELRQSDPIAHELVWGRHVEGLAPAELAKLTGRHARWISGRVNRAVNKFRAWLLKHRNDDALP